MKSNSSLIRDYVKTVKSTFPTFGKFEKKYLSNLEVHLHEYLEENPSATYEDLVSEFGTPSSIISEYFSEIDEQYLLRQLKIRKHVKSAIAIILILALLLDGWCYYLAYRNYINAKNENIVYEETIIKVE